MNDQLPMLWTSIVLMLNSFVSHCQDYEENCVSKHEPSEYKEEVCLKIESLGYKMVFLNFNISIYLL